jgi:prepilin-type N-terminal cleavage/methylation domain-containing protein
MTSPRFHLRSARPVQGRAFTLIELLVVLAIIGLILALSLPNFRGMNQGRVMEGAARQLLDDLALARQTAIATRSTVAVVFISPDIQDPSVINPLNPGLYTTNEAAKIFQLQSGALTSYALFAFRKAGDQPGQNAPHYLTPWRTLPEKVFIAEAKFDTKQRDSFRVDRFPFPFTTSRSFDMPYVAFNAQGQCLPLRPTVPFSGLTDPRNPEDNLLPLASGSIMYTKDAKGAVASWTVQEIPPNNSVLSSNVIHIDWLTGRAKIERADVVKP